MKSVTWKRNLFATSLVAVAGLAATACGSSGSTGAAATPSSGTSAGGATSGASSGAGAEMPTVTMMVGGIDKQIYLPYQLAEGLGYYKKFGVKMQLSTEQSGGVGAETAMASGQVDFAGAWYNHTITFQQQGKPVTNLVQLSGAPGERVMCANGSKIHAPADWRGKSVGVTDLGSGTDDLTRYLAARQNLGTQDFNRIAVGAGNTLISSLQHQKIACGMTTQPTVSAIEKKNVGYSAIDLATTAGAKKWLGGTFPAAGLLALDSWVSGHQQTVQKVVDALVATMHYISKHSAADIAAHLPPAFVSNPLVSKADYIATLNQDKGQFLPDGMMPANGPQTVLAIEKTAGKVTGKIDLSKTFTNSYAIEANKTLGYTK